MNVYYNIAVYYTLDMCQATEENKIVFIFAGVKKRVDLILVSVFEEEW